MLITNFHSLYSAGSPTLSFVRTLAHSFDPPREIDEEFIERNRGHEARNSAARPNSDESRVSRSANYSAVRGAAVYQTRPSVRCRPIEDRLADLLNCGCPSPSSPLERENERRGEEKKREGLTANTVSETSRCSIAVASPSLGFEDKIIRVWRISVHLRCLRT